MFSITCLFLAAFLISCGISESVRRKKLVAFDYTCPTIAPNEETYALIPISEFHGLTDTAAMIQAHSLILELQLKLAYFEHRQQIKPHYQASEQDFQNFLQSHCKGKLPKAKDFGSKVR